MKKLYESPEVEITKFQVESLMDEGIIDNSGNFPPEDDPIFEENIFGF